MKKSPIIIVAGPTASGKTALAVEIALSVGGVVINADSKQVYQNVPIITAQPDDEEKKGVEHLLYGFVPVNYNYTAAQWAGDAKLAIEAVLAKGKVPILVGGTGMYLKSLISGLSNISDIKDSVRKKVRELYDDIGKKAFYELLISKDMQAKERILPSDKQRMIRAMEVLEGTGKSIYYWHSQKNDTSFKNDDFLFVYVNPPRELIYKKVNSRFSEMIEKGALEEVRYIIENAKDKSLPLHKAHGVPELVDYLEGNVGLDEAIMMGQANTRKYVKRQTTWFKHQLSGIKTIEYRRIV
jgi:tRNA dimethylallyltransferase